ncbi:MAG: InlB B-repeat-containing protein [Lachnospiraceae bacterium]|nr:InlB B-repeat-containing protein [Lachnospiraceae bacterium]
MLTTFVERTVPVEGVEEGKIVLGVGQEVIAAYKLIPADCTGTRTWKMADTSIATVSAKGIVTGRRVGTTKLTITITDDNGVGKKFTCDVVVTNQLATGVELNASSLKLDGGQTYKLTATVSPTEAGNKEVKWSSSDTSVATVDNNGVVKAIGKGSCSITATVQGSKNVNASCSVSVKSNLHVATNVQELASPHPYNINMSDVWAYTDSSLPQLVITFSKDTKLEEDSEDSIEIRDKDYSCIGTYKENQLSGKTITVPGDTVYIKLVSDGFNSGDYGFSVTKLAGEYVPDIYTVTYKYNDGETADKVVNVEEEKCAAEPDVPTRPDYSFEGWYVDDAFNEKYDFSKPVTGNITVYARWLHVWNVNVKLDGGYFYNPSETLPDGSDDFTKYTDVTFTVKESDTPISIGDVINNELGATIDWSNPDSIKLVKTGYTFAGWVDGAGEAVDFSAVLDSDMTINATWTALSKVSQPLSQVSDEERTDDYLNEYATITLASETPDAAIYYSTVSEEALLDGTSRILYTDGIKVADIPAENRFDEDSETGTYKVTVYAYASKEGCSDSAVLAETFTVLSEEANFGEIAEEDKADYIAAGRPDHMWVAGLNRSGYTYTGAAISFAESDLRVYDGKHLLNPETDYVISCKNNINAYTLTEADAGFDAAKAPAVIVTGKGNYSGNITKNFIINPMDLGDASVTTADKYVKKTGKAIKPATTVTFTNPEGTVFTLKSGTDYELQASGTLNPSFTAPGCYTVEVVGKYDAAKGTGNYTGTTTFEFTIVDSFISFTDKTVVFSDNFNTTFKALYNSGKGTDYDGTEKILPEDEITVNGVVLERGTDYTVRYLRGTAETGDFIMPGTITAEYTGLSLYSGTVKKTYKINAISLAKATFTEDYNAEYKELYNAGKGIVFDAREHYPSTDGILTYGDVTLMEDTDYVVTYSGDMTKVGTHTITYTGKGGYTGTVRKSFKITAFNLTNDEKLPEEDRQITVIMPEGATYVKSGAKPEPEVILNGVTLEAGKDYILSYTNNTIVNTYDWATETWLNGKKIPTVIITGKGNLAGKILRTFEIEKCTDVSAFSLVAVDKVYANKAGNYTTTVKVYDADSKLLVNGTDYDKVLRYYYTEDTELEDGSIGKCGDEVGTTDIVPVGTILRVEATLKGNYEGTVGAEFRIYAENISKATVRVNNQIYTGSEVCPDKSEILVTIGGKVLAHSDYEIVSYSNNINKGTAKVTIKGVGNYGGEKTVNFTIAVRSKNYVIVFSGNGSTSGSMKDMTVTPGKNYSLSVNAFKRNYYTFAGWNTKPDGSGTDYTMYVSKKDPLFANYGVENFINVSEEEAGKTLVLYAQWTPIEYTITYHLNGGINNALNTIETYSADSQVITIYAPEEEDWPEGYYFSGWYKENTYKNKISVIKAGSAGNLDLYAKWVPYTYTVSFDGNGATGKMADETFSYGIAKKLNKNAFKNNGYIFVGWSLESDGEAIYADAATVVDIVSPRNDFDGELRLYAVWRNEFNIAFEPDGGLMPAESSVDKKFTVLDECNYVYTYGSAYTLPTPTKTGYTFAGWFTDETFKTKVASIAKTRTGDMRLYAKWTPIAYKVVYNAAAPAGTKASGTMKQQTFTYGKEAGLTPNVFTVPGHKFAGWSTNSGASGAEYMDGETVLNLTGDKTINLYAVWTVTDGYAVTFERNDGSESEYYFRASGEALDVSRGAFVPVRSGYAFAGWYKEATFKTKVTKIAANVYTDMTLYAKWTPLTFKVAFNKNASYTGEAKPVSNGSMAAQNVTYGNTVKLNSNAFGIAGYKFAGWNTKADGSGTAYADCDVIDMVPAVNKETITLYAIWNPTDNYKVSFNSMGGTDVEAVTRPVKQALNLSEYVPTRDGYTFAGWYKEATLKTKMTTVAATVYSDVTLYAKWTPKNYKVTFAAGAPEGLKATGKMAVQTLAYGTEKALAKNAFAIKGYNFLGWSTIEGDTEAEFDNQQKISGIYDEYKDTVTLYAVWEKAEYGIVYNNVAGIDNSFNPDFYTVDDKVVLKEPECVGNTFLGWYKDAKFSKRVYEISAGSTGNVTLYAKWEKTR